VSKGSSHSPGDAYAPASALCCLSGHPCQIGGSSRPQNATERLSQRSDCTKTCNQVVTASRRQNASQRANQETGQTKSEITTPWHSQWEGRTAMFIDATHGSDLGPECNGCGDDGGLWGYRVDSGIVTAQCSMCNSTETWETDDNDPHVRSLITEHWKQHNHGAAEGIPFVLTWDEADGFAIDRS
jgi:hypothetical protein